MEGVQTITKICIQSRATVGPIGSKGLYTAFGERQVARTYRLARIAESIFSSDNGKGLKDTSIGPIEHTAI